MTRLLLQLQLLDGGRAKGEGGGAVGIPTQLRHAWLVTLTASADAPCVR